MPQTDQITEITPQVPSYFWITIKYHGFNVLGNDEKNGEERHENWKHKQVSFFFTFFKNKNCELGVDWPIPDPTLNKNSDPYTT